jgi:hypothetical protein
LACLNKKVQQSVSQSSQTLQENNGENMVAWHTHLGLATQSSSTFTKHWVGEKRKRCNGVKLELHFTNQV